MDSWTFRITDDFGVPMLNSFGLFCLEFLLLLSSRSHITSNENMLTIVVIGIDA